MRKPEEIKNSVASNLFKARKNAGLSQGQAADILEMHRPTISEIEAGRRNVTSDELVRFSELYNVTVDWITDKVKDDGNIKLVARKLEKLDPSDLEKILDILRSQQSVDGVMSE